MFSVPEGPGYQKHFQATMIPVTPQWSNVEYKLKILFYGTEQFKIGLDVLYIVKSLENEIGVDDVQYNSLKLFME